MGVIYPNRHQRRRTSNHHAFTIKAVIILTMIFVAANAAIAAYYHSRTYPRTTIAGQNMGNVSYGKIEEKASQLKLLPEKITLAYDNKRAEVSLAGLGISTDTRRTKDSLGQSRSWLPIVSLLSKHQLAAPAGVDDLALQKKAETLLASFHEAPADAVIEISGDKFKVTPGRDGYDLSIARLKGTILTGLDSSQAKISAPVSKKPPQYTTKAAENDAQKFQAQLNTSLTYRAGDKTIKPTTYEIAAWFARNGASYGLDDLAIRNYIAKQGAKAGVRHNNLSDAAAKTKQALSNRQALDYTLHPYAASKTYRYCVGLEGVDAAHAKTFKDQLADTYSDVRGWGLEGQVEFALAEDSCDFTVWLVRSDLMPSFGAICDPEWSCRVGPNVVINFTRWQETSPAWKASGGSVLNYRHMVINHETGHWFEFDHSTCPGIGQPAPVMQQQSINLGGCSFNPWPTAREQEVFGRSIGL